MKTLKRFGILSVIMAVALLIPAGAAEARHRSGGGVNVWVGPGSVGYSGGYYGGYYQPYYQPYYYSYPSQSYYNYSYPSYGSYYYAPSPYYGGYYGSPGFQLYIGQ